MINRFANDTCPLLSPVRVQGKRLVRVVAALVLVFACCGSQAQEMVAAVSRLPLSLPFYVAETQGYFAAEGLKLRIEDCHFGRLCMKRLLGGEVQIATAADAAIAVNSFAGKTFAILATMTDSSNGSKLLARRSAGINAPKDLIGKRIGTVVGTSAHFFLDSFLLFHGIDRREITLVDLQPDSAVAALDRREVDALAVFEPQGYEAARLLGQDGIVLNAGRISRTAFNIVVDRRIAGTRDAELVKLLRALERANRFIRDQPQQAQAIMRARLKLDQDFVEWIWRDYKYELSLDQSLISVLESQARWARREGYAAGAAPSNLLDYFYLPPMASVLPAAVTIVR